MNKQEKPDNTATAPIDKTQPMAAPTSDPTNPHNQEPADDWGANERASERRNNEPGLTEEERKQRRW